MRTQQRTRAFRNNLPAVAIIGVLLVGLGACGTGSKIEGAGTASTTVAGPTSSTGATSVATSSAVPISGSTGATAARADACPLLTPDDVSALVPGGAPTPSTDPDGSSRCLWQPTQSADPLAAAQIDVLVSPIPPMPPGATLQQSFSVEAADKNGRLVDGLGELALVESVIRASAVVKVVKRPYYLTITLTGPDARQGQDALVTIARAATGRLG